MKPVLKQYAETTDCTTIAFQDASVIPSTLPSYIIMKVGLFDNSSDIYDYLIINSISTPTFTQFLNKSVLLLNSFILGKTVLEDKLIELNCGIVKIEYHWFYTSSKSISYIKGKNELTGTDLIIKDSVYIQGETYTINKIKSTTSRLVTNEPLKASGSSVLIYGEFDNFYFINECSIQRGITTGIGSLSVLDCDSSDRCLGDEDKTQVPVLLKALMQLESAKIKLKCGDIVSANQLVKKLCNTFAKDCYNANSILSNCGCKDTVVFEECTTCNG